MKVKEFYEAVEADPRFIGFNMVLGEDPHDDLMVVEDLRLGVKTIFKVPVILELEWKELSDLITGKRLINPLDIVSRIVGYYSRVSNWNKSKIGELKDRRAGNYSL